MRKFLVVVIIILLLCAGFMYAKWSNLNGKLLINKKVAFEVESGMNADQIVEKLETNQIIKDDFALLMFIKLTKAGSQFIAGTYWLEPDYNSFDLIKVFSGEGDLVGKVTIIEGWDQIEIAAKLTESNVVSGLEFLDKVENGDWRADSRWSFFEGKPVEADLEGYLYPDTYFFNPEAGAKGVIEKMLINFDKKLTKELRKEIKKQDKTIFEVLTLASVVEKEMFGYEDRRIVADIFWRRMENGIPLQSDATINYITNKGTTRPSYADLEIQDPYNTYRNKGLPPGPICSPSLEAIKAVVYPKSNEYFYFLNKPSGEIVYSKTFEEHVENKRKYLD